MNMTVLSTSALIEEIHRCGYSILEDYLTEDLISVVSKTSLTHLSSTPSDFNVFIHINVAEVEENKVSFLGEVFDEVNKVAKFEFMRIIVSKNFMERKIKEKREKIQKY